MKKCSLIFIILTLGLLVNLKAESYPPDGWRVWIPIAKAQGSQKYPTAVAKGDTIHVIWIDNSQLHYKKSCDFGFTWSSAQVISRVGQDVVLDAKRNISIAGIDNHLYVVYGMVDVTLQRYIVYFCRSTDDGDTWEGYQCLASGLQSYPEPSITAANDSVRVAFHKDTGSWKDLIYKASGDNGTTWAPPDYISYGQNDHYPHIIMVNNIPHVVLLRIYGPGNTYILHAKPNPFSPVWEKSQIMNYGEYQYPLLAIDEQNRLHAIWERSDYSIWYARSLNNGDSWQDIEILSTSSAGSYLTTYWQGVFVVYQNVNDICGRLSTDFGASWGNQFIIDDYADTYEANCCIVNGHRTRHLIFQKLISAPDDYDLVYMANDDSLLSNSNRATAFNGGRHLLRDPFCNSLHLVYHSQERVHYSFSNDGGTTWAPYHIIEDSETQNKDYGWYPSVALIPGMLTMKPCVVYCSNLGEVKYRWLNEGTGQWQGFTILEAAEGHDPGPPSVVTYGDQVYMIFSVNHLDQGEQLWSAIYFYQFSYDATGAPDPITLDYTPFGPLAYSHVSITVDGNGDPHCVWEKKISPNNWQDIFYRWREGGELALSLSSV